MSKSDPLRDKVLPWLAKADDDIEYADRGPAEPRFRANRAFHYQQAAEKYIKAILTAFGVTPKKIHDIAKLLDACEEAGIPDVSSIRHTERLVQFAVRARYPEPLPVIKEDQIQMLSRMAKEVRDFVLARLPFSLDD